MEGVTHQNIQRGKRYPQPGFKAVQDKEGKWKAVREYLCHSSDVVSLSPKKGSPCDREGFEALGFENMEMEDLKPGISKIIAYYVGTFIEVKFEEQSGGPAEDTPIVTELVLGSSEEPVESHSRYDDLSDAEWEAFNDLKAGKLKVITDGDGTKYIRKDEEGQNLEVEMSAAGAELISKFIKGRDTVLTGSGHTWTVKMVSNKRLTSAQMARFKTIVEPPGNPPQLGEDVDWLFNGATQTEEGFALNISLVFLASGPGGWDPDHYKHNAPAPGA